jgi:hypothetical protein
MENQLLELLKSQNELLAKIEMLIAETQVRIDLAELELKK